MRIFHMAVAIDHHHGFKPFDRTRCKLRSFTHQEYSTVFELDQSTLTHSLKQAVVAANIHRSFSTPCLSLTPKVDDDIDTRPRVEIIGGCSGPRVRALVVEAAIAVASGVDPMPASNGLGGAYFLRGRNGDNIAVAKPIDEEPLAINNPKGFAGRILGQPSLRRSVRVGETGIREVAAYLLDHGGFAGVPPTALVKMPHVAFHVNNSATMAAPVHKIASLQRFVDHDFDAGDLGPSSFAVSSVHRIGILDIRLLNLDRHAGNILVKRHRCENSDKGHGYKGYDSFANDSYDGGAAELVPIDHGLCLPEWLDDPYFEWLHWPQASVPFSESEAEYIANLEPFKDAQLLRSELPSLMESSIRVLVLCTIFLKRAATAGLFLADIGDMMTREFRGREEGLSAFETLCVKAKDSMINELKDDDHKKEENEEDINMFQFDIDYEDSCSDVSNLPRRQYSHPSMSRPPKIPQKIPFARSASGLLPTPLSPLHEEDDDNDNINNGDSDGDGEKKQDDCKVGGLTKSISFSVTSHNLETEGISFRTMSEEEWGLFLESFQKLLPKAFEDTKGMGLKQRLGTSCKF